jgi:hypothetical protein
LPRAPRSGFHEADAQSPDLTQCCTLSRSLRAFCLRQRETCLRQERATGRRELHSTRNALEQERTELAFEIPDLSAQRGLRDVKALRRSPTGSTYR